MRNEMNAQVCLSVYPSIRPSVRPSVHSADAHNTKHNPNHTHTHTKKIPISHHRLNTKFMETRARVFTSACESGIFEWRGGQCRRRCRRRTSFVCVSIKQRANALVHLTHTKKERTREHISKIMYFAFANGWMVCMMMVSDRRARSLSLSIFDVM